VFTAPLHGFGHRGPLAARFREAACAPHSNFQPSVLNARNDPFVPATSLPGAHALGSYVTAWQPGHGGHVGFPSGAAPGNVRYMPCAVGQWLLQHRSKGGV